MPDIPPMICHVLLPLLDPGMCDPHCICSEHVAGIALGPVCFDSIMIDRDVPVTRTASCSFVDPTATSGLLKCCS